MSAVKGPGPPLTEAERQKYAPHPGRGNDGSVREPPPCFVTEAERQEYEREQGDRDFYQREQMRHERVMRLMRLHGANERADLGWQAVGVVAAVVMIVCLLLSVVL